jgi:C_GCAxxG_C_C family probable redox protein
MSKAVEFHTMGYNCAEAVIKALNEENSTNIPSSMATPFGGGMSVGSTCGAITGAMIALGALRGREDLEGSNESRVIGRNIMKQVNEKYGTFECVELKKNGVSCKEIIANVYDILKENV